MLAEEGYVAQADADALADAYRFLRRLEHRLQIVHDLQTHDLPADPHARTTLARSLGLADASALQDEYERQTELVRGIHERLFYRPLLEAFAGPVAPSPGVDRPATEELLSGLGFASTSQSFEVLRRLVDPATRMGKVLAHVFPVMVPALALASNPDQALVRLERIAEAVGDRHGPADALAADPAAALRLAHVAAASAFATDLLVASPERLTALADGGLQVDAQAALVSAVGALRVARTPTAGDGLRPGRRGRPRRSRGGRGRGAGSAVRGHRHGQARRARAEHGLGSGSAVRLRGRGARRHATRGRCGGAGDARDPRRRLGARRRPATRRPQRPVGSLARRLPRVLGAIRGALGVPVVAPRPVRRGRRAARPAVRAERRGLRVSARRHHRRPRGRDPPDARTDRARAREAARGREVPLQARRRDRSPTSSSRSRSR